MNFFFVCNKQDVWKAVRAFQRVSQRWNAIFFVYQIVLEKEPQKRRGYLKRLCGNPQVVWLLGGADHNLLNWAIRTMEKPIQGTWSKTLLQD